MGGLGGKALEKASAALCVKILNLMVGRLGLEPRTKALKGFRCWLSASFGVA